MIRGAMRCRGRCPLGPQLRDFAVRESGKSKMTCEHIKHGPGIGGVAEGSASSCSREWLFERHPQNKPRTFVLLRYFDNCMHLSGQCRNEPHAQPV